MWWRQSESMMAAMMTAKLAAAAVALPPPCSSSALPSWPRFHVFGNGTYPPHPGGAHDVNALFKYKGHYHLMNQEPPRGGGTGWSHLISDDLVTWKRLPTILGPSGWDGSLTIIDGVPTILFDCQSEAACRDADASADAAVGSTDRPLIGVARPAAANDSTLTTWTRDAANPIRVNGSIAYAGPSNLWKVDAAAATPHGGKDAWRMVMINGKATGLYETTDPSLHEWTTLNASFYATRGGGGGLFHRLPGVAARARARTHARTPASPPPPLYTHFLQASIKGTPWFALGAYDEAGGGTAFWPISPRLLPLDASGYHVFSMIGSDEDTYEDTFPAGAREEDKEDEDKGDKEARLLHIGWLFNGVTNLLSSIRHIGYLEDIEASGGSGGGGGGGVLTANPIDEYEGLRKQPSLIKVERAPLVPSAPPLLLLPSNGRVADCVLTFHLPSSTLAVNLTIQALGTALHVDVGAAASGDSDGTSGGHGATRLVSMALEDQHYAFSHPATSTLDVRLLLDQVVVEAFVGGGRGVLSVPLKAVPASDAIWVSASDPAPPSPEGATVHTSDVAPSDGGKDLGDAIVAVDAEVWAMGCGWAASSD